ncbi:MAG: hypothetical protein UU64_C0002G0112 [candidate division WWE3 bacterium GW2011_GWF2_41_45]|uniref:Uncharacterized protein n=1 Tax=candidate division WWE3 bacterium GW2011_GWC2_41_23 TaxID=1619123 RepID=A0A0G0VRL0_UNCKA|nr:MAG: hypothetical protein UU55_C0001G0006 [candidate division WWE3 bacterium GW2011_GWC2_41_23]KKS10710.1 MAG: hypothetical protein UU64_C0002G0112 [candidate division WWE3 bacterium GW2011_GWF2_41_45]KKS12279.1 MAG: hypothetical protein UU68_C0002G0005 [candidate division WWE3 bacterium GW2011_GWF1_41_53]KKS20352.1 MAG: hypothetical protein UU79_C0001G0006 [candidate division WWE3 bacterium GW2011_GWE1_41_72]KKS28748.1 MAG: hypothetical protein UU90_C0018G0006 [candidate division WWE3 bacte
MVFTENIDASAKYNIFSFNNIFFVSGTHKEKGKGIHGALDINNICIISTLSHSPVYSNAKHINRSTEDVAIQPFIVIYSFTHSFSCYLAYILFN